MTTTFPLLDIIVLAFAGLVLVQIISKVLRLLVWLAALAAVVGVVWLVVFHGSPISVIGSALSEAKAAPAEIVRALEHSSAWVNKSLTRLSDHLPASLVGGHRPPG